MRYPPKRKQDTRRKIVDAASRAFRLHGVEGASVSDIMADAGLTVGGFYRHFESKEQLFQEALDQAMDETLALMQQRRDRAASGSGSTGEAWLKRAAAAYLTPEHRELRSAGCPLPGLTAEVGRRDIDIRRHFETSLQDIVGEVAMRIDSEPPEQARRQAWGFISTLVGSLLLARGVADDTVADEILFAGREVAAGLPARSSEDAQKEGQP